MKGNKPKQPRLKKALSLNTKRFDYEDFFMGVLESKNYSKKRTFTQDYRLKKLTEFLKLEKGNLLDIGCGGGIITESLPYYYPKVSIYGCDISLKAIKFSKKLGSGKVNYSLIKNKRLPYPDNYFDAIFYLFKSKRFNFCRYNTICRIGIFCVSRDWGVIRMVSGKKSSQFTTD